MYLLTSMNEQGEPRLSVGISLPFAKELETEPEVREQLYTPSTCVRIYIHTPILHADSAKMQCASDE
jgi:hypothetical protein